MTHNIQFAEEIKADVDVKSHWEAVMAKCKKYCELRRIDFVNLQVVFQSLDKLIEIAIENNRREDDSVVSASGPSVQTATVVG